MKVRTTPASGDHGTETWQLHETFLFDSWEHVSGRSLMVLSPKTPQVLKVVDNISTESVKGLCEEDETDLRCRLASAVGLVVTESAISPVRYCWQLMGSVGRTGE